MLLLTTRWLSVLRTLKVSGLPVMLKAGVALVMLPSTTLSPVIRPVPPATPKAICTLAPRRTPTRVGLVLLSAPLPLMLRLLVLMRLSRPPVRSSPKTPSPSTTPVPLMLTVLAWNTLREKVTPLPPALAPWPRSSMLPPAPDEMIPLPLFSVMPVPL